MLRRQWNFFALVPPLVIVMTWPAIARVFDSADFWLASSDIDAYMLFWDAWYGKLILAGKADFYFTDLLFHPNGVSLAFHNFCLPHMILLGLLQEIMPLSSAYNLAYLILVLVNAYAAYIYVNYLFGDKWIALFGAVVFGANSFTLAFPAHPNIAFIATLPLSLYFFQRAVCEERWRFAFISGLLIGATAFIGMYTLVCLLICLMFYVLAFALSRWKDPQFWLRGCLTLFIAAAFILLRFVPMLTDPAGLAGALGKNAGQNIGNDLLAYFVSYRHPITSPFFDSLFGPDGSDIDWMHTAYLGYAAMSLAVLALARRGGRRRSLAWALLLLTFLFLRLGANLKINDIVYSNILLPKHYLEAAFPHLFAPFWSNSNFMAGALLPLAALSSCGLASLCRSLRARWRIALILALCGVVAFENYERPQRRIIPADRFDFIAWLAQEDQQDAIRVINLPLDEQLSKVYDFYQTFNGYPQVEGRPTRVPPAAYEYIDNNLLLKLWRNAEWLRCLAPYHVEVVASLDQLIDDGFTHLVWHKYFSQDPQFHENFDGVPISYQDKSVMIIRVADLREVCRLTALAPSSIARRLKSRLQSLAEIPFQGPAVLTILPDEMARRRLGANESAVLYGWGNTASLGLIDGLVTATRIGARLAGDIEAVLRGHGASFLAYDPQRTDESVIDAYRSWMRARFQLCGNVADAGAKVLELYMRADLPCELALADGLLTVSYDNGMELANALLIRDGAYLDVYLLWKQLPTEAYGYSIQIFDRAGDKAIGQDGVVHFLSALQQRVDLSSLAPGDYIAKLILYNYETGAVVPGVIASAQTRFERELEIGAFSIE